MNIKVMKLLRIIASGLVLITIALSSASGSVADGTLGANIYKTAAQSSARGAGELRYKTPEGWVSEKPTSSMRVAQFKLPKAEGDTEDASLVLYYFGSGEGGSIRDNIDRWIGQIEQPDGSSSNDKAKMETLTPSDLKVTTVDVTGTYTAEISPGSGTRHNKPNYRLRAAIVETPKGSYFAKLVGPEKTVKRWDKAFVEYVQSFEFKKAEAGAVFH